MRRMICTALLAVLAAPVATPAVAQFVLPSGQELTLYDVVLEPDQGIARFRFLAPDIAPEGRALGYADVEADFAQLCAIYALPALKENDWETAQIVITLSDREVEFGKADPDATQIFEAFTVENDSCIWEQF